MNEIMSRLTKDQVMQEFDKLEPHFKKFCAKYPEFDMIEMLRDLFEGNAVLWANHKMFAMGRPNEYHNKTYFLIEALGGEDPEEWVDQIEIIEEDVKAWGFDSLEFYGRPGWKKYMGNLGYGEERIVMRKGL